MRMTKPATIRPHGVFSPVSPPLLMLRIGHALPMATGLNSG